MTGFSRTTLNSRIAQGKITPLPKPPGFAKRPVLLFYRADVKNLLAD